MNLTRLVSHDTSASRILPIIFLKNHNKLITSALKFKNRTANGWLTSNNYHTSWHRVCCSNFYKYVYSNIKYPATRCLLSNTTNMTKKATVKKTAKKAVKKTITKSTTKKTAKKKTAKKVTQKPTAKKTTKKSTIKSQEIAVIHSDEEISAKAYDLYNDRIASGKDGSSESDWFAAVEYLKMTS